VGGVETKLYEQRIVKVASPSPPQLTRSLIVKVVAAI